MTYTIRHRFPAERGQLGTLRSVAEASLRSWLGGDSLTGEGYDLLLALQEAVTNVIRHAYAETVPGETPFVEVDFTYADARATLRIRDWGQAFDPSSIPEPDFENPRPGGYGIFIMKSVTDRFDYRREGDANVLTLEKEFARGPCEEFSR
ncbi:MAG: ATP-binding protein [Planctomycetes bacterium]|nr:ATP-binding protein [Planctomycetota bacterium]